MKFLEKDLEQIIWETNNLKLQEKGLPIKGIKKRQLRIGMYGIADLVTFERVVDWGECYLNITVYELKKEKAGISAFLQAVKYVKGLSSWFDKYRNLDVKFNIVLCSKEIDKRSDYIFLTDLIDSSECQTINSINNYSFEYGVDGILFKQEHRYTLKNEGF